MDDIKPYIIASMHIEGFKSDIWREVKGGVERVWFIADADIDADGANGQNGQKAAYRADDRGSELLANGGMAIVRGKVRGVKSWFTDIVVLGSDGEPFVDSNGNIYSKTSYHVPGFNEKDPHRYLDAATIKYGVVPPIVIQETFGAVLGCSLRVTNLLNDRSALGCVGEGGPRDKNGELSIAMAEAVGIPSSPRSGGMDSAHVRYELFPGRIGIGIPRLQRLNGTYVYGYP